jgi:acetoin utilization protein AcuC
MVEPAAFIYHDVYAGRGFSKISNSWRRYAVARDLARDIGLLPRENSPSQTDLRVVSSLVERVPDEATDDELLMVHTPEHLARVREGDERGTGFLDYGDTPAWNGVWRRATLAVGGTLLAARLVASGRFRRAFNPAGGLHHARRDRAAGFCPFNDLVVAVRCLQREHGYRRIAIVDLDGHHGDGTEALLYEEPVFTVSMHRHGGRFYPGTGAAVDRGDGRGSGYNLNVPLERGTADVAYLHALRAQVMPAIRVYRPEILFLVVGADSHRFDPLVRLGLTLHAFLQIAEEIVDLADDLCDGRLVAVAGGGYAPEHVARCWAVFLGSLSRTWRPHDDRLAQLFEADRFAAPPPPNGSESAPDVAERR